MRLKAILATVLSTGLLAASMALPMGLVSHAAGHGDASPDQTVASTNHHGSADRQDGSHQAMAAEGTVSAISSTSLTLTLQGGGDQANGQSVTGQTYGPTVTGQTYTYTLASPLTVTYRGQMLALSNLTVGSQVNLHLNSSGAVSLIVVQRLAETVSGTIVSIDKGHRITVQEANGTQVEVKLKERATISGVGGATLDANQLAVGDAVTASGISQEKGLLATSLDVTMMVTSSTTSSQGDQKDHHGKGGSDHKQGRGKDAEGLNQDN